jgi:hypothetical protein
LNIPRNDTHNHGEGSAEDPTEMPKFPGPHPHHLIDALNELINSKYPGNSRCLKEAHPQ